MRWNNLFRLSYNRKSRMFNDIYRQKNILDSMFTPKYMEMSYPPGECHCNMNVFKYR